jgi:2,3-bisphosphoglycerate-independent phosphoglycerate mutase
MTSAPHRPKPLVLCILDGWGYRTDPTDNALAHARLPTWNRWLATLPHALLETSGRAVGLPDGQMGNSEVGHMNIGAGRVLVQDLPRIDAAIADGWLQQSPVLGRLIAALKASGGTCHLMGLVSPGGVHAHQDHIAALARVIDQAGVPVCVHAFLDGRDTPPQSAAGFMTTFLGQIQDLPRTRVATVAGRYYAMDRDKRWDRVEKAYAALVDGIGTTAADPSAAIAASYAAGVTDEFMLPAVMAGYAGMSDGDGVLMANFRADRAREILTALLDPAFTGFPRARTVRFAATAGMVEYSDALNRFVPAMFPPQQAANTLGEVIAKAGLTQLRIAETEKYAHVTFFLNGGEEKEFPGESRIMVPSPKVATYDLQPEMSALEVTDRIIAAIEGQALDVIIVNYANGDMVGHTGIMPAAIKAAETVDACLARLEAALKRVGGAMLVCADHGNLEMMRDAGTDAPHTQHTTGPVSIVLVNGPAAVARLDNGRLADVAPTTLALLGLAPPAEMTGRVLLQSSGAIARAASA